MRRLAASVWRSWKFHLLGIGRGWKPRLHGARQMCRAKWYNMCKQMKHFATVMCMAFAVTALALSVRPPAGAEETKAEMERWIGGDCPR